MCICEYFHGQVRIIASIFQQILGLSRTKIIFQDFPGLEILQKKIQGLSQTLQEA